MKNSEPELLQEVSSGSLPPGAYSTAPAVKRMRKAKTGIRDERVLRRS